MRRNAMRLRRDSQHILSHILLPSIFYRIYPMQEYPGSAIPSAYLCFCGKAQDPPFDPWNAPHR